MTGVPPPFAQDYAFQRMLAGNPRSLFNMLPGLQPPQGTGQPYG